MPYFIAYLWIINAMGLLFMHMDKEKARKNKWRVSEKTLLSIAALGGSVGSLLGMYLFRHKTKHLKFTLGVPVILAVQIVTCVILISI